MVPIDEHPQGLVLKIFVQPRASKNMISGVHGDALKVKLTAPPVDGAANKMCLQFLAKWLKVPKSSLDIITGQTARNKTILVHIAEGDKATKERIKRLVSVS